MPEFNQRVAVLHEMGYISPDDTVAVKGRVACEINSGSEIVATEMIFGGGAPNTLLGTDPRSAFAAPASTQPSDAWTFTCTSYCSDVAKSS